MRWLICCWQTLIALLLCTSGAVAEPPGEDEERIAPANVNRVAVSASLERSVHRIVNGPGAEELSVLHRLNSIEILNETDLNTLRTVEAEHPTEFAVSDDGSHVAWCENRSPFTFVQETESGRIVEIDMGTDTPRPAFSPDSGLIAIGATYTTDPTDEGSGYSLVRLFDTTGTLIRTMEVTREGWGAVRPVFSPDGRLLAVGNRNYGTRLFEVETGKLLRVFPRRMTHELAFHPGGETIAAGYVDGAVALWDVETGELRHLRENAAAEIYTLDWSPDGDLLVTAGRGKITLWNPQDLTRLRELPAPSWVIQVRFSRDGTRLYSSGGMNWGHADPRVDVWTVAGDIADSR